MELIYLGIILFIVGIGATLAYDKWKAGAFSVPKSIPKKRVNKRSQSDQQIEKLKTHIERKKAAGNVGTAAYDQLIDSLKVKKASGLSTVTIQNGSRQQTVNVERLIQKLEDIKRRL